jgi:hypothetical protein
LYALRHTVSPFYLHAFFMATFLVFFHTPRLQNLVLLRTAFVRRKASVCFVFMSGMNLSENL